MITVSVLINGQPIYTRTAVREKTCPTYNKYRLDDGTSVVHKYEDGAVPLAIKMLETIKEQKREINVPAAIAAAVDELR